MLRQSQVWQPYFYPDTNYCTTLPNCTVTSGKCYSLSYTLSFSFSQPLCICREPGHCKVLFFWHNLSTGIPISNGVFAGNQPCFGEQGQKRSKKHRGFLGASFGLTPFLAPYTILNESRALALGCLMDCLPLNDLCNWGFRVSAGQAQKTKQILMALSVKLPGFHREPCGAAVGRRVG